MTTYFVDTSALGRRYLHEVGSAWVRSWMASSAGNVIIISDLAPVELSSTFARLQRDGTLSSAVATALQDNFLLHVETEYLSVGLDTPVLTQARLLVGKYSLRTLDALQLASAQIATTMLREPIIVVSGDNRLLAAASAEGFAVDNPYIHP